MLPESLLEEGAAIYTLFPNLFAVATCYMKTRPYLVNCKQTVCMW